MVYSDKIDIGHVTEGHIEKVKKAITFSDEGAFLNNCIDTVKWTHKKDEYHFKYAIVMPENFGLTSKDHLYDFIAAIEDDKKSHFISFEEGLYIAAFHGNKLAGFSVEMFTREFFLEKKKDLIIPGIAFKDSTYLSQKDFLLGDKIASDSKWLIRIGKKIKGDM